MSRMILATDRIKRARTLIQKARDLPVPTIGGRYDITYLAEIKSLLQQARDLVKFIAYTPSATPEVKNEALAILKEADQADKEILRYNK
jgi:hypothetical protein